MKSLLLCVAAFVLAIPSATHADAPTGATAVSSKFRIDKARIDRALADMVSSGRAVGVSALLWEDGREVYFGTAGRADREAQRPMRRDTLVQIYSMTKPVTGVALMKLWEQGRFRLDDPLALYLPEFGQTKVFAGVDAAGKPVLRAPDRSILIRDILRHTAGFGYGAGEDYPGMEWSRFDPLKADHDLAEFGRRLAKVPLLFDPGRRWHYSAAVDVQALLVEKLTGVPFESYVRQQIFAPLGMRESAWTQPENRFPRLAALYEKSSDGKLQRVSEQEQRGLNFTSDRKLTMGGAGIVSSADDYMRFARMLLNNGSLDGVRILKPSTVKLMATDQLDPLVTERSWLPSKGNGGFGIDFFVRTGQPRVASENRGALGEYFWDGRASTLFWVDPVNNLTAVFLVQVFPFDGTLHRDFRRAVYGDSYLGPKGD
ncbi:beta-lactamase family protein [Sphingomonas sp. SUN019]|uniref:serine hydrolase domain-containing protein n=1 Tax=Sphingomonas sp. SUN019 TaxID=2937788 RepID=UPI0021646B50|nr:serine hydrolase domain-containing protein [Sphingomonas sp. SUN019]UVO50129.1 beta-lactamase family protein [Sphingomonas sp. SUN019]